MFDAPSPRGRGRPAVGLVLALVASSAAVVALTAPPAAAARCVGAAPSLETLTLTPASVDVTEKSKKIKVAGTTAGAALDGAWVWADSTDGAGNHSSMYLGRIELKKRSFSGSLPVPKGVLDGSYRLAVSLSGKNGKGAYYSSEDLAEIEDVQASFPVVSTPDTITPTVSVLTVGKKSVNTKKKAAKVKVTATIKDQGGSGVERALVEFRAANADRYYYAGLTKKSGNEYSGTLSVRKWAGNTKLTVGWIEAVDGAGNVRTYTSELRRESGPRPTPAPRPHSGRSRGVDGARAAELPGADGVLRYDSSKLPKKLKKTIKVKSKTDNQPPRVESAQAKQKTFKINYKVKLTDDRSGVGVAGAFLSGHSREMAGIQLVKKGKFWVGTGRIPCDAPAGRYLVRFELWDKAGNWTETSKGTVRIKD